MRSCREGRQPRRRHSIREIHPADIMKQFKSSFVTACLIAGTVASGRAETAPGQFVTVVSKPLSRTVDLPGEFLPFMTVSLHAKVQGFVEKVLVDRGSMVKQGD